MTNRDKATTHSRRLYQCSACDRVVAGNGGRSSHQAAHDRRGEVAYVEWYTGSRITAGEGPTA